MDESIGYVIQPGQIITYKSRKSPIIQEIYVAGLTADPTNYPGEILLDVRPLSPRFLPRASEVMHLGDVWRVVAIEAEGVELRDIELTPNRISLDRLIQQHKPEAQLPEAVDVKHVCDID